MHRDGLLANLEHELARLGYDRPLAPSPRNPAPCRPANSGSVSRHSARWKGRGNVRIFA